MKSRSFFILILLIFLSPIACNDSKSNSSGKNIPDEPSNNNNNNNSDDPLQDDDSDSDQDSDSDDVTSPTDPPPKPPPVSKNNPPEVFDISIEVAKGMEFKGQLKANDIDNNTLIFSIVSEATHGDITEFDPKTGEFTYIATSDNGTMDSFRYQVYDGEDFSNSPATVSIEINEIDFTGHWRSPKINGPGNCEGLHFRMYVGVSRLYGTTRSHRCKSGIVARTTSFNQFDFDVDESGNIYSENRKVGTITDISIDFSLKATILGCGTVISNFNFTLTEDGFLYKEYNSGSCRPTGTFSSIMTKNEWIPLANLTADAGSNPFGIITQGESWESTFVLSNIGFNSATSMRVLKKSNRINFKGGEFPGEGGTCGAELDQKETCTIVLVADTSEYGHVYEKLELLYHNGLNSKTKVIPIRGSIKPLKLTGVKTFVTGNYHSCVLLESEVRCWGEHIRHQIFVPELDGPKMLSAGFNHNCVLDNQGVKCWGDPQDEKLKVPKLKNPKEVTSGANQSCAVDDEGVKCWGDRAYTKLGYDRIHDIDYSKFTNISVGHGHLCGLYNSEIHCFSSVGRHLKFSSDYVKNPNRVSVGYDTVCTANETLGRCWQRNSRHIWPPHSFPIRGDIKSIQAGAFKPENRPFVGCVLAGNEFACQGDVPDYWTLPELTNPSHFSFSIRFSCAIDNGDLKCWGEVP